MLDSMVYRQDSAKQRQPVFKFTHRSKIGIFAPQGRIVASIHVKFGRAEGHMGPLGHAKFHANWCPALGTQPPIWQKLPLFGTESPRSGEPFDRFLQLLGDFTQSAILH